MNLLIFFPRRERWGYRGFRRTNYPNPRDLDKLLNKSLIFIAKK